MFGTKVDFADGSGPTDIAFNGIGGYIIPAGLELELDGRLTFTDFENTKTTIKGPAKAALGEIYFDLYMSGASVVSFEVKKSSPK